MAVAKQAERRQATRARLVEAARILFVEKGYENCSTEALLQASGMSRGALYHHFASKKDIFEAVFVSVSNGTIAHAQQKHPPTGSATEDMIRVCLAWLAEVRVAETAAILIDQGPQVLGWLRARDLEAETSLGLMMKGLELAIKAGELAPASLPLAARILNATLAEIAVADRHGEPRISRTKQEAMLRQVIAGMAT